MVAGATVLLTLALQALGLFVLRRRSGDPALVSFAAFAGLYATRLFLTTYSIRLLLGRPDAASIEYTVAVLTYTINVPMLLFAVQVLGPGWLRFRQYLLYAGIALAIIATAGIAITGRARWA